MKRKYKSTLPAQILLTLMQQVPMYQHQSPRLDLPQLILFLVLSLLVPAFLLFHPSRPPLPLHLHKLRSRPIALPHKPLPYRRPPMTPPRKTQTPISHRRILQRNPKPHRARRIRVQKRAILMRRHPPANLRLLANDHALQHPRITETKLFRYTSVQGYEGSRVKGRGQGVQVVAYLINGAFLGFAELALGMGV